LLAAMTGTLAATPALATVPAVPAAPAVTEQIQPLALPYCNNRGLFTSRGYTYHLPVSGSTANCVMDQGANSWGVFSLQEALVYCHGQNTGGIDGIYGPMTRQAVRNVQGKLGITRDGVYGPQTRDAMRRSNWWIIPGACRKVL